MAQPVSKDQAPLGMKHTRESDVIWDEERRHEKSTLKSCALAVFKWEEKNRDCMYMNFKRTVVS